MKFFGGSTGTSLLTGLNNLLTKEQQQGIVQQVCVLECHSIVKSDT